MENELKKFKSDKKIKNSYKISKIILSKINLFKNTDISKEMISDFSEIFDIPKNILEQKLKKIFYSLFDYKLSKFKKKIYFSSIFFEILKSIYIFLLIFISKKNSFSTKFDFILHGIDDERSFKRYVKLMNKFKSSLVITKRLDNPKINNVKVLKISYRDMISSNAVQGKKLRILIIFLSLTFKSFYSKFNYIYFFNLILFSILKNFTIFEKYRGKYFMEDRFYNTCSIRNFFFRKFGGEITSTPQKNIVETAISYFIDTDIFFSLANENYSIKRLKNFGGRIGKTFPVGSFFLEHDWYRKKKDLKKVPRNEILIMGLNPNTWLEINNLNKKNYEYTVRYWIKKVSKQYPKLRIMIKHHGNLKDNSFEKDFFEKENVTSTISNFSKNKSYGFMKKSKIIFSFGSTTTLEAISMGKQSYFMDPGFNSKNFFYGLKNLNDIRISNYNDFKKLIEKVIFLSKKKNTKKIFTV